jgi:hypothetical protein
VLFIVRGEAALEAADAVRRAYLVEDPHLLPVQEIVVLDDPREDTGGASSGQADDGPTTVVEYPMPPAPPLAALLTDGPLHPETARAIIGEAATGLEAARRRGVRHQFLDSNRVFVDTRSGDVSILGIGVEAASHVGLDRSREVASFQDTAALVALLYRALTGRTPQHDGTGTVPRPSTLVDTEIPADLDLLCDLVLNESADEIPETTRGLIEALEPWQSIPVTFEAYPRSTAGTAGDVATDGAVAEGAVAEGAVAGGAASGTAAASAAGAGTGATEADAPTAEVDDARPEAADDALPSVDEPTQALPAADQPDAAPQPDPSQPDPSQPDSAQEAAATHGTGDPDSSEDAQAGGALAAGATGAALATGGLAATGASGPGATDTGVADTAPTTTATAESTGSDGDAEDATPQSPPAPREDHSAAASALVRDLHLDERRDSSAFPGHLEITQPRRPEADPAPSGAAADEGGNAVDPADPAGASTAAMAAGAAGAAGVVGSAGLVGAAGADGTAGAAGTTDVGGTTGVGGQGDGAAGSSRSAGSGSPSTAETAAGPGPGQQIPSRTSGTHWPLSPARSPEGSAGRAEQPPVAPGAGTATADHAAPTPSAAPDEERHEGGAAAAAAKDEDRPTEAMAAVGATAALPAAHETGPIVVQGRRTSLLDEPPEDSSSSQSRSSLFRDVVGVAVDADDPETFALGPRDREKRSLQSQWIIVGGVIVVMFALVLAVTAITRDLREIIADPLATSQPATTAPPTEEETGEAPVEPTPTDTEEPELPAPELAGVEVFTEGSDTDPDNADQQDRMTDGDPETFWSTKHYGSPDFGGLKDGAGVRLEFAEPSTLKTVTVTTARNNGGLIELRAVNDDGSLGDVLASGELAGDGQVLLETPEPVEAERVALWIPELPPDSNEQGRYRARIAEIQVG